MLEPLPHPCNWLIVEDAHDNPAAIIEYLHQFMKVGDYLVMEDTSPYVPSCVSGHNKPASRMYGPKKLNVLKNFLRSLVGQNFKVDSFFTDLYGYNCTGHWHGFLKKCSA